MPKPIIELEDVWRTYEMGGEEVHALAGIDLRIDEGEYVSIMGPSGCGKSTLLNVLGCLDQPTAGNYRLAGEEISELDDDTLSLFRGRRIGFIFQSYNLIQQLSVLENIEVPLFYQGVPEADCRARAVELAEQVGLTERMDHRPNELSGGQQQRVAIARALANEPVVIFADEATGNLDSQSGDEILAIFEDLHQRGRTLVFVTHDEAMAERTTRTIRLKDGVVRVDTASGLGSGDEEGAAL